MYFQTVRDDSDLTILSSTRSVWSVVLMVRDDSDLTILSSGNSGMAVASPLEMILI